MHLMLASCITMHNMGKAGDGNPEGRGEPCPYGGGADGPGDYYV